MKEYVRNLVNSKEVVSNQIDNLTSHNEHLCKELIKVDQLAEQLERQKNFVVDTADKELEEAKIELICQQNNIIVLEDTIKRLKSTRFLYQDLRSRQRSLQEGSSEPEKNDQK